MSATHPDETTLLRSIHGDLPDRSQAALKQHLARCRPCRDQRDGTKRLHERLANAGDALAFHVGDPFAARPAPREVETPKGAALKGMAAALARLDEVKSALKAAIEQDASKAGKGWRLDDAEARLAAAHLLEEAATGDPLKEFAAFAGAVANRVEEAAPEAEAEVDAVVSRAQLAAVARLAIGNWRLFCGRPKEAAGELAAAWTALAGFDAPEHFVAWVEAGESLRRSYEGRPVEGRLLAERALATFERYGLARGVLRARHARAVALYTAGAFRDAHREFRAALGAKDSTQLDRARAVSGAAFCLAARGRFHDAAKEYSRVRRRLKGEGAQVEQYLLQGEMKAALGTAGRWHQRKDGLAAFALPEAGGAFREREIATEIVKLAGEQGIEAAKSLIDASEADPGRGYALLYAAQLAMPKVSSDPAMYVELAKAIAAASKSLPFLKDKGPAQPVCREQVVGEAFLVESSALNTGGRGAVALAAARRARAMFSYSGDDSFSLALADYFEGSAASFDGDYFGGWRLLKRALTEFQAYGQENWAGRTEAALGVLLNNRGKSRSALHFLNRGLRRLHPQRDAAAYTSTLGNRASALLLVGRLEAAKSAYAKALASARRMDSKIAVLQVRYGLASIELKQGRYFRAMNSFEKLSDDAWEAGMELRGFSADLRIAECVGRLGMREEMLTRVRALRRMAGDFSIESDPPLRELFAQADEDNISSNLVAHVVEYLEARDRGVQKGYKPFRLVVNGN